MKFYVMDAAPDGATLYLRDGPVPEPGAGQVLVKVHAASLNRGEFIRGHGLQKTGTSKPIGMECAGTIEKVGTGVMHLGVGDHVMGRCAGAFAEYAAMDAREAIPMPPNLSFAQCATVPLTFLVVHDMLVAQGRLKAGEWVLITGVSSGVGVAALSAAKAIGAKVIGTSGSQAKLDALTRHGLDAGIETRAADFHQQVTSLTSNHGVDLVINTVGGSVFAECVKSMAFEGRLATVGYVDDTLSAEIDIQALHAKRLTLFGVSNKMRTPDMRAAGVPHFVRDFLPLLADGKIEPIIDRVYPFDQLADAKAYMESNQQLGKIVLEVIR